MKNYNLNYFYNIFGEEKEPFKELLETLLSSLEEWQESYKKTLLARDSQGFSFHRHKAITLMENLEMGLLIKLSEEAKNLLASGGSVEALEANARAAEAEMSQALEGLREDLKALN